MAADMAQCERSNIKCYASVFSNIQNIDYNTAYASLINGMQACGCS